MICTKEQSRAVGAGKPRPQWNPNSVLPPVRASGSFPVCHGCCVGLTLRELPVCLLCFHWASFLLLQVQLLKMWIVFFPGVSPSHTRFLLCFFLFFFLRSHNLRTSSELSCSKTLICIASCCRANSTGVKASSPCLAPLSKQRWHFCAQ